MSVVAVIPAVDEPDVDRTIRSLLEQTVPPERVVVAVNNTSSRVTHDAAARVNDPRVTVLDLGAVAGKKAGALNRALDVMASSGDLPEFVMVVDADTIVSPRFVEAAMPQFDAPDMGAVGGIFHGTQPRGWLQWCQALEYARYGEQVERTRRVMVLTGTAAIIRTEALEQVSWSRTAGDLPGLGIYDPEAITEDNELTLALRSCGWRLASPAECTTTTELMGTLRDLQAQRIRWYRGALDNLRAYGWTPVTRRYWVQQAMLALCVLAFSLYLTLTAIGVVTGTITFSPVWTAVGVLFAFERAWTARSMGWRGIVLAALLVPEMLYSLVLQVAFARGVARHLRHTQTVWHHAAGVRAA